MNGRLLIITGDGKGKTTAAMGMVLRTLGHDGSAGVIQFMKSDTDSGEIISLKRLFPQVKIAIAGLGFVPKKDHPAFASHQEAARKGLELAGQWVANPSMQMVLLDELCGAVHLGLLEEEDVVAMLALRRQDQVVVLTGRNASPAMIELADTVSEIQCVKHAYEQEIPAQKGVEF